LFSQNENGELTILITKHTLLRVTQLETFVFDNQ